MNDLAKNNEIAMSQTNKCVVVQPAEPSARRLMMDVDDVLDTVAEMAEITAGFAREATEDTRTRTGAAMATVNILAKIPPILNLRTELVANDRRVTTRILCTQEEDPRDPFDRIRRVEALETLHRHNARLPAPTDDEDDVLG